MLRIKLSAIEPFEVAQCVDKVLSSSRCVSSPQLAKLLNFLVSEAAAGRGEQLKQYHIGTAVLGRPDSFDPDTDPTVRVAMGRLRKLLDCYYAQEGRHQVARFEIPVGSYVPHLAIDTDALRPAAAAVEPAQTQQPVSGSERPQRSGPLIVWLNMALTSANFLTLQYLLARL